MLRDVCYGTDDEISVCLAIGLVTNLGLTH